MVESIKAQGIRSEAPSASLVGVVNGPYPKTYFNGFALAGAVTDAILVLQNGESPVAAVQTSWAVLKELARALDELVKENERQIGGEHLSLMEAAKRIRDSK